MNCPLCNSKYISKFVSINTSDIIDHYKTNFNIIVSNLFLNHSTIFLWKCEICNLYFFTPIVQGDGNFYNELQKKSWYYSDRKPEFLYANKFINYNHKVIEIGSGTGNFSEIINSSFYIGIELSTEATKKARKKNILVINMKMNTLPKAFFKCFDILCYFQVLEHIRNPYEFIRDSLKLLKKNGLLIISVPSSESYIRFRPNSFLNMPPHHLSWWSKKSLFKISEIFNLEIISHEHHILDDVQLQFFIESFLYRLISINKNTKLVDHSKKWKIIEFLSKYLAKALKTFKIKESFRPFGDSITFVYRNTSKYL